MSKDITSLAIAEDIQQENYLPGANTSDIPNTGIFKIKSGNAWLKDASEKAIPESLYKLGDALETTIWFEGEVGILFAETNVGKSILAVQIAEQIAKTKKVIYGDFELSEKQFEARYSCDYLHHYNFPEMFYRAEINPDEADYESKGFRSLEEYINTSLEQSIISIGAKVLIIDNITYLRSETEKAKEALPLMKYLKALKNKYGLSILVLAHTPKRNPSNPISRNDLQGSKMLINFCDSAFAIGESFKDKRLRYIKQIKARNTGIYYDTENVALFEITKPYNFLAFTPVHGVHTTCEHEHLKTYTEKDREAQKEQARELARSGKSQRDIAALLGIAASTVNKYLKII